MGLFLHCCSCQSLSVWATPITVEVSFSRTKWHFHPTKMSDKKHALMLNYRTAAAAAPWTSVLLGNHCAHSKLKSHGSSAYLKKHNVKRDLWTSVIPYLIIPLSPLQRESFLKMCWAPWRSMYLNQDLNLKCMQMIYHEYGIWFTL